jgi:protein tyrosine/serine phosphatase
MSGRLFFQRTHLLRLARLITILASCAALAPFAGADPGQQPAQGATPVSVENFGKVNDHIYRGAQPDGDNYRQLAAIGVKTVLDLRGDSEPNSKVMAEGAGLRYINLPLADKQYPQRDAAQRFLEIVNDQSTWPVYVHCAGGRHRTGAMIAVYRITIDGWDIDRAYQEMKDYGFYTRFGHACYRDYVNNYYRNWQEYHQTYMAEESAPANSKMTRLTKMTRIDMMAGVVGRPIKRIYKARPILK